MPLCRVGFALTLSLWLGVARAGTLPTLPNLQADPAQTSVSGLSSGGYMATQLQVAYSGTFARGAGILAAGPWYCAQGLAWHALRRCLGPERDPTGGFIPVATLQGTARLWAAAGLIDPLPNLAEHRVYIFSGSNDSAVRPSVVADLARWYAAFVPAANIRVRNDVPAEHGMVTDRFGNRCEQRGLPYIQNCGVDVAGEILQHLYGTLAARNEGAPRGRWLDFNQHEFIRPGRGMADEGRLYVPPECEAAGCRLHVVLHGCGQNLQLLGDTYTRHTGYTAWADSNRFVLLFPQTDRQALNACWDWWGFTGANFAQKSGAQLTAIKRMVDRLTGQALPGAAPHTRPNPSGAR